MSGKSSGERVAFDIGGFVLKRTGTEPRSFYHKKTETGTEMKFLEPHSSTVKHLVHGGSVYRCEYATVTACTDLHVFFSKFNLKSVCLPLLKPGSVKCYDSTSKTIKMHNRIDYKTS